MTRALGFLAGVCLTVATLVLLLDRWENQAHENPLSASLTTLTDQDTGTERGAVDSRADSLQQAVADASTVDAAAVAAAEADEEAVEAMQADHAPTTAATGLQLKVGAEASTAGNETDLNTGAQAQVEAVALDTDPGPGADLQGDEPVQSHVFWSPFRSEWAAKGFARRLTNSTQIPIEVIHAGPANYRVAFDYSDESERREHIERIESITGLQLE